jgi:hypothetical protein
MAAQFLVTSGDNADDPQRGRVRQAPRRGTPTGQQRTDTTGRHRLSRGGDRAASSALYIVTIVRMRHHQPTRDYLERRSAEG